MGANPSYNYEQQMSYLISEFKSLNFDQRKYRFGEFIRREADIFAGVIEQAHVQNIVQSEFDDMMMKRQYYLKELFNCKDVCVVF